MFLTHLMLDAAYRCSAHVTANNWPSAPSRHASYSPEAFAVAHEQRAVFEDAKVVRLLNSSILPTLCASDISTTSPGNVVGAL
jgi:hypothetical protein